MHIYNKQNTILSVYYNFTIKYSQMTNSAKALVIPNVNLQLHNRELVILLVFISLNPNEPNNITTRFAS